MKRKLVTPEADAAIEAVFDFIAADNLDAAERYYRVAYDTFFELPDIRMPVRASDHLPEYVRSLHIPGFDGYVLRIAIFDDAVFLLTALRPGATDEMNDAKTQTGLRDI